MGTRSLTVFLDSWTDPKTQKVKTKEICVMYRQMDGHPDSHGQLLADFLKSGKLVNGLSGDKGRVFNGMGCLTAQVIEHFKSESGPGGIYVEAAGTRDAGEEYIYTVYPMSEADFGKAGKLGLKVQAGCMTFFGAPGTKQKNMPLLYDGPVDEYDGAAIMEKQRNLPVPPPNDHANEAKHKQLNTQKKRIKAFVASNPRVKVKTN